MSFQVTVGHLTTGISTWSLPCTPRLTGTETRDYLYDQCFVVVYIVVYSGLLCFQDFQISFNTFDLTFAL